MKDDDEAPIRLDPFPDMPYCYQASWESIYFSTGWTPISRTEKLKAKFIREVERLNKKYNIDDRQRK